MPEQLDQAKKLKGRGEAKTRGDSAEMAVAHWLESHGLLLLEHQYNVPRLGEIDLIMRRGNCLYFIEVKARTNLASFGGGLAAITAGKVRRIRKTALYYCQSYGFMNTELRFLAAEVELVDGQPQGPIRFVPMN